VASFTSFATLAVTVSPALFDFELIESIMVAAITDPASRVAGPSGAGVGAAESFAAVAVDGLGSLGLLLRRRRRRVGRRGRSRSRCVRERLGGVHRCKLEIAAHAIGVGRRLLRLTPTAGSGRKAEPLR
jgi:hypothetical protein